MSKTSKFAEMRRTHQEWEAFASELESELSAVIAERDVLAAALKKARERIKYQDPKILGMQEIDDALSAINQQELTSPTGSEVASE